MALQVNILTPDRVFWNDTAEEVILPTNTGQMGVLTDHAPLMTALDIGVMLIRTQKEWLSVALMGGFALVKKNQITVLVNEAESANTIDPAEAEKSYEEARAKWNEASGQKQKVEANFALKRARARFQIVNPKQI
jgi:F-type H+-transporting ATPase subunit epsilon